MKRFLILFAAVLLLGACASRKTENARYDHVILLGFDGLAGNTLENSDAMPELRAMMADGAWTLHKRSILPTSSAANWASMFMGAGPDGTGYIEWNSRAPHFTPAAPGGVPTVFRVLRDRRPDAEIGAFWQWDGIKFCVDTTALSSRAQFDGTAEGTDAMADFAAQYIRDKKPVLAAFAWDYPDHTGHASGWGSPEYYENLAQLDRIVGKIRAAVEEAGLAGRTLILVTADHGGHGTGHGQPLDADLFAPFVALGPGVRAGYEITGPIYEYDIAATVADALGIREFPASWRGLPVREIYE
jgi:predicted AlkP superfamily pyrophosphatase or phosphodiesterase